MSTGKLELFIDLEVALELQQKLTNVRVSSKV